ncbi:9557_t:CDS:2 [Ambispora leptoticha]|uniref:9557_t:CDS:1 n=1 Tax=Ambispora leptoticha TaxID=144679 RepID=A0A9N9ET54_9GLOM|nr:9557_t:CDS:2 [Ambispora leptoticha]
MSILAISSRTFIVIMSVATGLGAGVEHPNKTSKNVHGLKPWP